MSAKEWLLENDDFEYQEINGVDVPTYDSIAKVMEAYHESELKKLREAQVSEQLFAFLEYCDNAGWIKNVDKKRIIEDYEKVNNCV